MAVATVAAAKVAANDRGGALAIETSLLVLLLLLLSEGSMHAMALGRAHGSHLFLRMASWIASTTWDWSED